MADASAQPLRTLLEQGSIFDVLRAGQPIVCFEHDDTIGNVLERLAQHKLLSGPVLMRPDHQPPGRLEEAAPGSIPVKSILGFVDVGVILRTFLQEVDKVGAETLTPDSIEEVARTLCERPVLSMLGDVPSQRALIGSEACSDWALKGNVGMSLLDTIREGFVQPIRGPARYVVTHRMAVFDSHESPENGESHLRGIVSQSDVIRYVFDHLDQLGDVGKTPISELLQGRPSDVVIVSQTTQTLKAFQHMYELRVSAMAVVDAAGHLTGNLSASDLRCLAPGLFAALLLPVEEYLSKRPLLQRAQEELRSETEDSGAGDVTAAILEDIRGQHHWFKMSQAPPVACLPHTTLQQVIRLAATNHVHRVWLVDLERKPAGLATLSDLLRILAELCKSDAA